MLARVHRSVQSAVVHRQRAGIWKSPDRARELTVDAKPGTTDQMSGRQVGRSIGGAQSRRTLSRGAVAVAFVLLKKAACGVARIGAGLAALRVVCSLVPAKPRLEADLHAASEHGRCHGNRERR